jgi:Pilin (bacterial filament)
LQYPDVRDPLDVGSFDLASEPSAGKMPVHYVLQMLLPLVVYGLLAQSVLRRPSHTILYFVVMYGLRPLGYLLVYQPKADIMSQVLEAEIAAEPAKKAVRDYFYETGLPPMNRAEAGLPPHPVYHETPHVRAVDIVQGAVIVTLNEHAAGPLAGKSLTMTPYEIDNARFWIDKPSPGTSIWNDRRRRYDVYWRCGNAGVHQTYALLGTAAGGATAMHLNTTIPYEYLPVVCRSPMYR